MVQGARYEQAEAVVQQALLEAGDNYSKAVEIARGQCAGWPEAEFERLISDPILCATVGAYVREELAKYERESRK
jgi:hypothetical protein